MVVIGAASLADGGAVYEQKQSRMVEVSEVWDNELSIMGQTLPMVRQPEEPVDEPQPQEPQPTTTPEPEPTYLEATPKAEASSAEGTICSIWQSLPCGYVLAVAQCESGADYYDDWSTGYYIGTFQLDPNLHGWRFLKHGWNIYTDGPDVYKNSVVAYELYLDNGMQPWPICRYR